MNKRYYEHTLPIIRGSLSNTYFELDIPGFVEPRFYFLPAPPFRAGLRKAFGKNTASAARMIFPRNPKGPALHNP